MLFQGKDGQLNIIDYGTDTVSGSTRYYMEVLFCEMDLSMPTSYRPRTEETLVMDRGNFDSNAHFIEGNDEPIYTPMPITFSCRAADTINTRSLSEWLSGATAIPNAVGGTTTIISWDTSGVTVLSSLMPALRDAGKNLYRIEVLWDGDQDLGYLIDGVYFTPGQQTITESADGVALSCNGIIYGGVTRITTLSSTGSGTTYLAFS